MGALLIDGWWELTEAGTLMTLDFQVSVKDSTGGQNPISQVDVYIDDLETPVYSSGPVSLTEFPPPPGMVFRRDVTPGTHTVVVEVTTADGQSVTKTWDIDCSALDGSDGQECTGQPDCTCDVCE